VNTSLRDLATEAIVAEVKRFKKEGVTEQEFLRGKEQIKSAFIMGQESTSSQMLLYAKNLILLNKEFDFNERMQKLQSVTLGDVHKAIELSFDIDNCATATVGTKRSPLKVK
jgi:predicted Zn-dependent peptidase